MVIFSISSYPQTISEYYNCLTLFEQFVIANNLSYNDKFELYIEDTQNSYKHIVDDFTELLVNDYSNYGVYELIVEDFTELLEDNIMDFNPNDEYNNESIINDIISSIQQYYDTRKLKTTNKLQSEIDAYNNILAHLNSDSVTICSITIKQPSGHGGYYTKELVIPNKDLGIDLAHHLKTIIEALLK